MWDLWQFAVEGKDHNLFTFFGYLLECENGASGRGVNEGHNPVTRLGQFNVAVK
jgi:hypothetical protein